MTYLDFELCVDNRAYYRKKCVEFLRFSGVECDPIELEAIIGEAIQNVLRHAYPPMEGGRVTIEVDRGKGCHRVMFRDYGKGFDPDLVSTDSLVPGEGGMGIPLMGTALGEGNLLIVSDPASFDGTSLYFRFPERGVE